MLAVLCVMGPAASRADALDDIKARGRIVVGVKRDVLLWGIDKADGAGIVGLEPDLAADLARQLGVKVELVGLLTAERLDAVDQGRVDVLIATLSDTPERRQRLTLVEPHYYSSGANLLARKSAHFSDWKDLRNRRICGRRGAFYNRLITVEFGADIVALYGNDLSQKALRDGRCDGLLYDDTAIVAMLQEPRWRSEFEMPLKTLYPTPWSVALPARERGGRLHQAVSRAIVGWHRDGVLSQLEQRWGIPESPFVARMHELWRPVAGGASRCGDHLTTATPEECR
jgi:polar amino acid transport system substrate-binding protein